MRALSFLSLPSLLLGSALGCTAPQPPARDQAPEEEIGDQRGGALLSTEAEVEQIKARLATVKGKLNESGAYNCCVQPTCDWCALHEGSCACFTNLMAGEAVCPDCGLGWHNGHGIVDGVDADDVEWTITHEHPTGGHQH